MVWRVDEERCQSGGILSLARFADEHSKALEYDLITKTGYTLDDIGSALSWSALSSFISKLDIDSALGRELNPKWADWSTTLKTNLILANIYDALNQLNSNVVAAYSGKKSKPVKPYPRPFELQNENTKHFGSKPMPVNKLREWFEQKRAEHGRRND